MRIHHKSRHLLATGLIGSVVAIIAAVFLTGYQATPPPTSALNSSEFKAGRIIDDAVFYNSSSMTAQQIQDFLNKQVPTCDTMGTKPYSATETRAQSGIRRGNPPPYTCLKDYRQDIPEQTANNYCGYMPAAASQTAAQIIYSVSQACVVNPQVLLVLLQKEQSLVTDDWPFDIQYRSATGYGCPDTAACDAKYYGFFNQIYRAAWQYQVYRANPGSYNYRAGRNNYIQYNPVVSCGGETIYIENQATAGLYIYTPYVPNYKALDNLYGTGDSCSAYGNRNFWRLFQDWFGSTLGGRFVALDPPRWMQIKNNGVQKIDIVSGEYVGDALDAGRQIRFVDSISIDNKWYLRTEFNYNDGGLYGISQDELEEIPYQSISPKWMTFIETGNRSRPSSRTSAGDTLVRGTSVKVVDQIIVDGNVYYRTEFNHNNDQDYGIHSRFLADFGPIALDGPRNFCSSTSVDKINPQTGAKLSSIDAGNYFINKKTLINGVWYYQMQSDNNTLAFIDSNNLHDACYIPFEGPRNMRINQDVVRFNPYTNAKYDTLVKDQVIMFTTKIFIGGQWYFRTEHNTLNNIDAVIPAYAVSELQ